MIGFINNNKRQKRFRTERDRYKQRSRPVPLKSAEQSLLECCAGTYLSLTRQEGENVPVLSICIQAVETRRNLKTKTKQNKHSPQTPPPTHTHTKKKKNPPNYDYLLFIFLKY